MLTGSVFSEHASKIVRYFEFDVVTNWFFGASPYLAAEELCQGVDELTRKYPKEYREKGTLACFYLAKESKNKNCKFNYVLRSASEAGAPERDLIYSCAEEQNESVFKERIVNPDNVRVKANKAISLPTASKMQYSLSNPGQVIPGDLVAVLFSITL
ncbi:hypothetical protein [Dickeya ananatis]